MPADPNEALVEAIYADIRTFFINGTIARTVARSAARACLPIIEAERQAVKEACAKVADIAQDQARMFYSAGRNDTRYATAKDLAAKIRALDLREIG